MYDDRIQITPIFADCVTRYLRYSRGNFSFPSDMLLAIRYLLDPEIRGHDLILQILQQNIIYISDTTEIARTTLWRKKKKKKRKRRARKHSS